jgi:hypothetical protein
MRAESESLLVISGDSPIDETVEPGLTENIDATGVLSSCYKTLTRPFVRLDLRSVSRVTLEGNGR